MQQFNFLCARVLLALTLFAANATAATEFDPPEAAPGNLRFSWIHGSISAKHNTDLRIQVHRYNEHTYILRQNPAVHWEAPFMYLLFGENRALLLDTGATEEPEYFPLRATVDALIERWSQARGLATVPLTVLTTSDQPAQTAGRAQFLNRPLTQVVAPTPEGVAAVSGMARWPDGNGTLDLGGRTLTIIPTPGTAAMAVSVYDPYTDFLFTGTTLLPGRIVIRDFDAYRASLQRLLTVGKTHPVKFLMGGQIDMTNTPGLDYRLRSNYRPHERALQLPASALKTGYDVVQLINGRTHIEVLPDFIVMNGVGRGARPWGYPVYMPDALQKPWLR